MLDRYSSRRTKGKLAEQFLVEKLQDAASYDRIAGYFCSSILEIAGEAVEGISGKIRIICNSSLAPDDVKIAAYARMRMKQEWGGYEPEEKFNTEAAQLRLKKLYELLSSDKMEIKVLPDEVYGLMHGKAGVITYKDGRKSCFLGSINETRNAWTVNYEIVWADDDPESVKWVQDEFDYFWNSPFAIPLSDFIIKDIKRISGRVQVSLKDWRKYSGDEGVVPAAAVEEPVFRKDFGLWEHQKYFVERAFREHKEKGGARLLLADMVGLGKTIELAMTAKLIAIYGDKPILIIVPKTIVMQWQDELMTLLDMPSAIWNGKCWVDENGFPYQNETTMGITKCPRKIGIISQGLITSKSETAGYLKDLKYDCVILDEAHRARRKNIGKEGEKARPNNLLAFMDEISLQTKSMLLATATPVQINPIEAFDLLDILARPKEAEKVMGSEFSVWRKTPETSLDYISGNTDPPMEEAKMWEIVRNPLPMSERRVNRLKTIRDQLDIPDNEYVLSQSLYDTLRTPLKDKIRDLYVTDKFVLNFNPYVRCIVRRSRRTLEDKINPETGEPYLKKIMVELCGDGANEALELKGYLKEAYDTAQKFCDMLKSRVRGGGFMATLLLRRIGSTMLAGENTAKKMLAWTEEGQAMLADLYKDDFEEEDEDSENSTDASAPASQSDIKQLTPDETKTLELLVSQLKENKDADPKYNRLKEILNNGIAGTEPWKELGCIVFSQYYDSAAYVAELLSKDMPGTKIGLYAGGDRSGVYQDGFFNLQTKEIVKNMVRAREIKILVGTDAASEGLNLQILSTLINLDLPWNPTRLEQRKGRIQRIGQAADKIFIYNMRYKGSVEDKVHSKLSDRLKAIYDIFGQIPEVLEDVWIAMAQNDEKRALELIDGMPKRSPFEIRYEEDIPKTEDWSACEFVLDKKEKKTALMQGW